MDKEDCGDVIRTKKVEGIKKCSGKRERESVEEETKRKENVVVRR